MSTPTSQFARSESWLKQHETIILGIFVLALGIWGFNKWVEKSANDANAQVVISKQNQAVQDAQVKTLETQLTQQSQQFTAAQAQMHAEVMSLASAIASRDTQAQTKIQQVTAANTTPSQAVTDLQAAYPALPAPVTATSTGADVPTVDVQQFTVAKIEGDTAKADLKDTQSELQATAQTLQQSQDLNLTKDNVITGLQTDLTKHDKTCEDEKKQMKADARRGKFHAFLAGAATVGALLARFIVF